MVQCPFCDGQGIVNEATVISTNQKIYICDECDTIWTTKNMQEDNCLRFRDYMNKIGLKGLWSELSDVKAEW